jgi:hypothetical protein
MHLRIEIVENPYGMAFFDEPVDDKTADESGPARYEYFHRSPS